jgi:hypothetical protein
VTGGNQVALRTLLDDASVDQHMTRSAIANRVSRWTTLIVRPRPCHSEPID